MLFAEHSATNAQRSVRGANARMGVVEKALVPAFGEHDESIVCVAV